MEFNQNNSNVNNLQYSQQQVGYDGVTNNQTVQLSAIKIRNIWSLISATLLLIAMFSSSFVHYVDWGDWEKNISLSDLCSQISRGANGLESDYKIVAVFAGWMFYVTIVTFILSVLGGFADVMIYKKWASLLTMLSFVALTIIVLNKEIIYLCDETSFDTGYYVLGAGVVSSIISIFKDNPPMHSLTANNDLQAGEWRCPKCDTKNIGTSCKICGMSRR